VGVVFNPERDVLTIFGEKGFFAAGQPQQWAQPPLAAPNDVERSFP